MGQMRVLGGKDQLGQIATGPSVGRRRHTTVSGTRRSRKRRRPMERLVNYRHVVFAKTQRRMPSKAKPGSDREQIAGGDVTRPDTDLAAIPPMAGGRAF